MEILVTILLLLLVIAVIGFIIVTFIYIKHLLFGEEEIEDKRGLYDFIKIEDHIINLDHIIYVKQIWSVQDENYKLVILLDNNLEPITLDYDDRNECVEVFLQIQTLIDAATVV